MFARVFMTTILNVLSEIRVFLLCFCHRRNNCGTGVNKAAKAPLTIVLPWHHQAHIRSSHWKHAREIDGTMIQKTATA